MNNTETIIKDAGYDFIGAGSGGITDGFPWS
jgi:hypothetical protein